MSKTIVFQRYSAIEAPMFGDRFALFDSENTGKDAPVGFPDFHDQCSTYPNAEHRGKPYTELYGVLAPFSDVEWLYVPDHYRYGSCILLAGGGLMVSEIRNVKHGGAYIMNEIFFHRADSLWWRGSAGCITARHDIFDRFISYLKPGDTGKCSLLDMRLKQEIAA